MQRGIYYKYPRLMRTGIIVFLCVVAYFAVIGVAVTIESFLGVF